MFRRITTKTECHKTAFGFENPTTVFVTLCFPFTLFHLLFVYVLLPAGLHFPLPVPVVVDQASGLDNLLLIRGHISDVKA